MIVSLLLAGWLTGFQASPHLVPSLSACELRKTFLFNPSSIGDQDFAGRLVIVVVFTLGDFAESFRHAYVPLSVFQIATILQGIQLTANSIGTQLQTHDAFPYQGH